MNLYIDKKKVSAKNLNKILLIELKYLKIGYIRT